MKKKLFLSFISSTLLYSTIIQIPWDYVTIQEGIDASVDGDTVLVGEGTYFENLVLDKEITLASHALIDDLSTDWLSNENINNTIISGAETPTDTDQGSCLIIRDGNIAPTILGFTFEDGIGTTMNISDCEVSGEVSRKEKSGGAILMYKAYPVIKYNRFLNNGTTSQNDQGDDGMAVTNGGAMSHYNAEEVEFDEDRSSENSEQNSSRDIPGTMDIQNNYFENNGSGDGENFYSFGFEGSIDLSNSVFDNIDCDNNEVNDFVLNSKTKDANYIQNNISGNCIEEDTYYVHAGIGSDLNPGTEEEPFLTIRKVLSLVKEDGSTTYIHVAEGLYSPSTTGETFPITIPDNVHLLGENWENTIIDIEATSEKQARGFIVREVEDVVIANFTITGGSAEDAGCQGGGAISLQNDDDAVFNANGTFASFDSSNVLLENLYLTGNHAYNGGGIGVFRLIGPRINNVIVENNTALTHGGGIFHHAGVTEISNSVISGNSTENMHGGGLSIYITEMETAVLTNVEITNNSAAFWGGGAMFFQAKVDMIHTTVSKNTDYANNSVLKNQDGELNIVNSIIWDNSPNLIGGSSSSSYSNVPSAGNGEGNMEEIDPLFVNSVEGDFHIIADSPCRDSGTTDIDGDGIDDILEFQGENPDMGAYEYTIPHPTEFTFTIEGNSITLSWDPSLADNFQYYGVQMSTDSLFISDVVEYYTPDNTHTFSNLEYNTPYFFRVATMVGQNEWSYYSDVVTAIIELVGNDNDEALMPLSFYLKQNFPNPFNPSTTITYVLPEISNVDLAIYDLRGQLIKKLISGSVRSGVHTVKWDGKNENGGKVSAGIYLYKIYTGKYTSTNKMILLK